MLGVQLNTIGIPLDEVNNLSQALEGYQQHFNGFVEAQNVLV